MQSGFRNLVSETKAPLAAGLIVLLLVLQALAWSPALHCEVHGDASSPDHFCVVTTLAQGHLSLSTPGLTLALPAERFVGVRLEECPVFSPLFLSLHLPRGPPAVA
jgi:hypothetical protein